MPRDRGVAGVWTYLRSSRRSRVTLAALAAALALSALASSASAMHAARTRQAVVKRTTFAVQESHAEKKAETISTPQLGGVKLDRIGIIKVRPKAESAPNVLVMEPGTSAAAAYFMPFAKALVAATPGWQVWAVERRENFLEDQQELTKYKFGELPAELENPNTKKDETPSEQFFDYYLGYLGQDEQKATEEVTAAVTKIVTKKAEEAVEAKVTKIALEEVEAYVVEQVVGQAFEETGGAEPAFRERIASLAAAYKTSHFKEVLEKAHEFGLQYEAEHLTELTEEGERIGAEIGAKYQVEHAAELQKQGEEDFAKLVAEFTNHYEPVPESLVEFAKNWGMARTVDDLKLVIEKAKALGGKVVLGGHSLGGSVVTAYATWNFGGTPGADGLSGLVYDDGGSGPASIKSEEEGTKALAQLDEPTESPWLAFGGIVAPDLGLFSVTGSTLTTVEPKGPSLLEKFPFLPSDLKGPPQDSPATNEAGFGFSVNYKTSPLSLAAAQIHGGEGIDEVAELDGLHGWNGAGALTPVSRYAEMLAGTGLREASGSEWYFPARLTLDTGAVNNGIETPSQKVLGLQTTMGTQLPKSLHLLAIDTELDTLFGGGGQTVLTEAEALAEQNGISSENVKLIDRLNQYSHNDPAGALPEEHEGVEANVFLEELQPFLEKIAKGEEGA
ncbi:MAG: alpha/beta hydrolase [Solirubrobacterales bacterium]|nr:alpha/beta hydrolase [Solirubrobacterales bacterium]